MVNFCRTLVPEIRVRPEILRVFQYNNMLTCVIYGPVKTIRQVGQCADTWYNQIQPTDTLTVELATLNLHITGTAAYVAIFIIIISSGSPPSIP